jgi:hypothetical protein
VCLWQSSGPEKGTDTWRGVGVTTAQQQVKLRRKVVKEGDVDVSTCSSLGDRTRGAIGLDKVVLSALGW